MLWKLQFKAFNRFIQVLGHISGGKGFKMIYFGLKFLYH